MAREDRAKQADVPTGFCRAKCLAFRGDKCGQIMEGPGGCLWPVSEIKKAAGQGFKK